MTTLSPLGILQTAGNDTEAARSWDTVRLVRASDLWLVGEPDHLLFFPSCRRLQHGVTPPSGRQGLQMKHEETSGTA